MCIYYVFIIVHTDYFCIIVYEISDVFSNNYNSFQSILLLVNIFTGPILMLIIITSIFNIKVKVILRKENNLKHR